MYSQQVISRTYIRPWLYSEEISSFMQVFIDMSITGADPGFQVRGGGAHFKKLRRAEEGAKILGVFRVKNHYFTPKNHSFYNYGGRREKFWGISCEKSRFYAKKTYFFPILGGGGGAPPWIRPCIKHIVEIISFIIIFFNKKCVLNSDRNRILQLKKKERKQFT